MTPKQYSEMYSEYVKRFGEKKTLAITPPKLHTIRHPRRTKNGEKAEKQWKAGDLIHPAINNRSKNYFQFAPTIPCVSVQRIDIIYDCMKPEVRVDGEAIYYWDCEIENGYTQLHKLAINDGFESVQDFLEYFKDGVEDGQLIHWTPLKY